MMRGVKNRSRPIVIDAREIRPGATGVGRATCNLLSETVRMAPDQRFVLLTTDANALPAFTSFPNVELVSTPYAPHQHPSADLWLNMQLPALLKKIDARLYHGPAFLVPLRQIHIPKLLTVHDMSMFEKRRYYSRRFQLYMQWIVRRGIRTSDHVITVSESVRTELLSRFKIAEDRVSVVPNALAPDWTQPPQIDAASLVQHLRLDQPYVLAVGTLEPRKNPLILADAVRQVPEWKRPLLVWAGRGGYRGNLLHDEMLKTLGPRNFRWISSIEDHDLRCLMAGAFAVACPSLSEGFGITALEAMALRVPVICSDIPAHREVAGDAALYANPLDPTDFSDRIDEALNHRDKREQMQQFATERVQCFHWQISAKILLDIYASF